MFSEPIEIDVYEWNGKQKVKVKKQIKIKAYFEYEVKVTLRSKRTGLLEAEGVGSANSLETKYISLTKFVYRDISPTPSLPSNTLMMICSTNCLLTESS